MWDKLGSFLKLAYGAFGSAHPRGSLIVLFLIGGSIFSTVWIVAGRAWREEQNLKLSKQNAAPSASPTTVVVQGGDGSQNAGVVFGGQHQEKSK